MGWRYFSIGKEGGRVREEEMVVIAKRTGTGII